MYFGRCGNAYLGAVEHNKAVVQVDYRISGFNCVVNYLHLVKSRRDCVQIIALTSLQFHWRFQQDIARISGVKLVAHFLFLFSLADGEC